MKIAFDVKGTIEGPKQQQVLRLLRALKDGGHEIYVWSNSYRYAVGAVQEHRLPAVAMSKRTKSDADYELGQYMDVAIEDDRKQAYLAAKEFLWVDEIPVDETKMSDFIQDFIYVITNKEVLS